LVLETRMSTPKALVSSLLVSLTRNSYRPRLRPLKWTLLEFGSSSW
jgi:hypothetical protein